MKQLEGAERVERGVGTGFPHWRRCNAEDGLTRLATRKLHLQVAVTRSIYQTGAWVALLCKERDSGSGALPLTT